MAGDEDGEVLFEEGISWLPSHVLDEAVWDCKKEYVKHQQHHQSRIPPSKLPMEPHPMRSKASPRTHCRKKHPNSWASGGPGMQAIFLDTGKTSCGTGVFLPRRGGANLQASKKPACYPVLLPARVVQALNINVHEIGLQVSRRQDEKKNSKDGDLNSIKNKTGKEASAQCFSVAQVQHENASPDIFLPKEWTY